MRLKLLTLALLASFAATAQKTLEFRDKVYEGEIRTVVCYPDQPTDGAVMLPSAARLETQNLVLEFDDLRDQRNNYYIRLIHCNHDWTRSGLMDLDFMREYNEVPITDYAFSLNTPVPYIHYRIAIPPVKLPGNYVVMVYRDGNKQDLILTRRILVFDQRLDLAFDNELVGLGNLRSTNQALNFTIRYGRMEVINPASSMHVTIRQNQVWNQARFNVPPTFIREDISQLEFRFFDMDQTFKAGNEFRFLDFRSLQGPGQNVYKVDRQTQPWSVIAMLDKPRTGQAYAQYADLNGGFVIDNLDYRQDPWLSANYVFVDFGLESPNIGEVYVQGAFNGWDLTNENKMTYLDGLYRARLLLKQGFYNYRYWTPSGDGNQVEGNHFQTENMYEVLVYYRPFQPQADLLVGYFLMPVNPR